MGEGGGGWGDTGVYNVLSFSKFQICLRVQYYIIKRKNISVSPLWDDKFT
jgi:hypothetical protein